MKLNRAVSDQSLILPQHKEIEAKALELFTQHLRVPWQFVWLKEKNNLGVCYFGERTIALSQYWVLFLSDDEIKDTILHEIAHGMTWEQNLIDRMALKPALWPKLTKKYMGHDGPWEYYCKQIGAKPQACYEGTIRLPNVRK